MEGCRRRWCGPFRSASGRFGLFLVRGRLGGSAARWILLAASKARCVCAAALLRRVVAALIRAVETLV